MPSLYAQYIEELTYGHVVENEQGFASYVFVDNGCYIKDIYIKPEFRKQGAASSISAIIENIAKQRDCKYLLGSVVPSAKGSTTSLKVLLAYGFKLESASNDFVLFKKEL